MGPTTHVGPWSDPTALVGPSLPERAPCPSHDAQLPPNVSLCSSTPRLMSAQPWTWYRALILVQMLALRTERRWALPPEACCSSRRVASKLFRESGDAPTQLHVFAPGGQNPRLCSRTAPA